MYLRVINGVIEFVTPEIHDIEDTDVLVNDEDYDEFFTRQGDGTAFRLREQIPTSGGLFDYVEEIPIEETIQEETIEDLKTEYMNLMAQMQAVMNKLETY